MYQYTITGRQTLNGVISAFGDKNTALKLIPSTILTKGRCVISNIPDITDIRIILQIMEKLGTVITELSPGTIQFDNTNISTTAIDPVLARKLRASTVFMGPLIARFREVTIPHPGGCIIGKRPIDIHLEAFEKLGCQINVDEENYHLFSPELTGAKIIPSLVSVTGTENIMMAACLAKGTTVIEYAACEPSIIALGDFINTRGGKISGHGSPRIIIEGVPALGEGEIKVIPDRIEAGTFIILGALCGGEVTVNNCRPDHLEVVLDTLQRVGVKFERQSEAVKVKHSPQLTARNMTTNPYPGFPTDLQAPFTLLMTQAEGLSMIHETIFEGRLNYTELLNKMGANIINCDPHRAIVHGPTQLHGSKIISPDIRAGITLVMAALLAEGTSVIDNIDLVDRGYADLDNRLSALGATIIRKQIQ
jgi:UDP-N-acetylglucosamine 1-carboxyvinyltransferase